mgnify:FL=1
MAYAEKCQNIIDAERRAGKNVIVAFNYRWNHYFTRIKELLQEDTIGKLVSVDFHWYLNTHHGAQYFRRWHGLREVGGTLWVHKATHHFDLLNWWIDSEPKEVFAYGDLEFYGSNNDFRGENCRSCPHKQICDFYWDISKNDVFMDLYVANEKYDGYIRDSCVFRRDINIYDKMSAQVKYMNNVILNYSLTTYSPYEGFKMALNGTKGRIEAWMDIPYQKDMKLDQSDMYNAGMQQEQSGEIDSEPVIIHKLWEDYKSIRVNYERKGHWGGDKRLHEHEFKHPEKTDPYDRQAGLRDGAMSVLIGVAAVNSIESGEPVRIAELTNLKPREKRFVSI